MEFRDWFLVLSLVISLAPWIALWIIFHQLKTHGLLLRLNTSVARHNMFISLTDCLTEEAEKTMLLHVVDHFDPKIYREQYEGKIQAIRSYLLMKRKYLYLLFSTRLERNFPLQEKGIAAIWIDELSCYQEFRDVHASQGHYYEEFARDVDAAIKRNPFRGWMYQAHLPPDATQSPEQK
jgi:hypothetical protein